VMIQKDPGSGCQARYAPGAMVKLPPMEFGVENEPMALLLQKDNQVSKPQREAM